MTTPLTPEEVAKLRLPEGMVFVLSSLHGDACWRILPTHNPQHDAIKDVAEAVANGYLPRAALDALWAALDGKELVEVKRCKTCERSTIGSDYRLCNLNRNKYGEEQAVCDDDFCSCHKERT